MSADLSAAPPLMCLTHDGASLSHADQTRALLAAGARWIQLRMKDADHATWLATARDVVSACRAAGATCIINDSVDIALSADADGVHLGKLDGDWTAARARLGPDKILGGTVNDADAARRAAACGSLDYVGIGPWRFTTTKKNLAPVLGPEGITPLLPLLNGLPAWVIGGIYPDDLPAIRALGVRGVAVSSALFSANHVHTRHAAFLAAWSSESAPIRAIRG
jgi:thiamine-phosphate pyrophosphorylase